MSSETFKYEELSGAAKVKALGDYLPFVDLENAHDPEGTFVTSCAENDWRFHADGSTVREQRENVEAIARYRCPDCGGTDLEVDVTCRAKLLQNAPHKFETSVDEAEDGSHEWGPESMMFCMNEDCGRQGIADEFDTGGPDDEGNEDNEDEPKTENKCDDCSATASEIIGCPDGAEICRACFNKGCH